MDPLRPPEPPPLGTTIPRPVSDGTEASSDDGSDGGSGESRPVTADSSAGRDPDAAPLPDEPVIDHRAPAGDGETDADDPAAAPSVDRQKTAPAAAQIDAMEEQIEAERDQAETMFGISNLVAAVTFQDAAGTGGMGGALGAAGAGTGVASGIGGAMSNDDKNAGPDGAAGDGANSGEDDRSLLEEEYDPALVRRVSGYAAEGDKAMPTIPRDELNTGESVDPAFADAEAAANGAEAGAETEAASDATTDPPRMDDLVEDDPGTSGIRNRTDALVEAEVDLPEAAREHMGSPAGMRGDDPDAERFQAPRSWSEAGAEHAAEAASGAGDSGRGEGAGRPSPQTNGTPHPSDHARDEDDDGTLRADPAPGADDQVPGFEGSAGVEHGRGDEHGRDENHGRGRSDRDPEEIETDE